MIYAIIARYWRLLIPLVLVAAFALWLWAHDRAVIAQDRLEATVEARRRDAIADDKAGQVSASQAARIEKENNDARKAALDSDDPLRAGLDRLRAGKTGNR